nr:amino acid ABC transporter permease [Natronocella acetinitrilica]
MTPTAIEALLWGAWTTIWISFLAIIGGIPLGLGLGLLRATRVPVVSQVITVYVSLGRATPLVTMILFIFIGLPALGLDINRYAAAVFTLLLNTTAFNTEIWRSAYQAFPRSQIEAAKALGMQRVPIFFRIMLPQMTYRALPALVNEMTFLVKASPAIAVIGIVDLTRVTNRISAVTYQPLPPIIAAGILYMLFIGVLVRLQRMAENRASRFSEKS